MRPLLSLVCAPPAAFLLLLTFAHGTEPRTLTRWVERRLPEGAHVVERTSFGRVTLSCAAAEFVARIDEPEAVSVRRADLRFERDH